jgi:hypothetical protein
MMEASFATLIADEYIRAEMREERVNLSCSHRINDSILLLLFVVSHHDGEHGDPTRTHYQAPEEQVIADTVIGLLQLNYEYMNRIGHVAFSESFGPACCQ